MQMEKRVTRKEVNVYVDGNDGSKSARPTSSKFANQGKNLIVGSSTYSIPDPEALAAKYGIETALSSSKDASAAQYEVDLQQKEQKIQQLESAVLTMKSKIEEKNRKIEHLCVLIEALEPTPGINPGKYQQILEEKILEGEVDLRDSKIVSLAKKSHKLTMQVNKEKTINTQLNEEINDWKRRFEGLLDEYEKAKNIIQQKNETKVYNRSSLLGGRDISQSPLKDGEGGDEATAAIIQALQKQVKETSKTIDELKRKMKELSDENTKLMATLKKEIGDGISLEQAVDGGWRGRAQQIVMLKAKIKQLESNQGNANASTFSSGTRRGGRAGVETMDVDSKAEESLQEMSRERRQIVEALTEERIKLIESNQSLEKKNTAQKARIQILENEVRKIKENITVALDKSNNDDQLIEVLREEINRLQGKLQSNQRMTQDLQQKVQHHKKTANALMNASLGGSGGGNNTGHFSSYDDSMLATSQSLHQSLHHLHHLPPPSAPNEQEWLQKEQQYQAEINRLQRLCRNQAEQLDSQDTTIKDLRKHMKPTPY